MFLLGPEYLALPRNSHTWIVEDLLPHGGSLNIYGRPKAGKSLFALQMASCISDADRQDLLGFPIHTHGTVCYIQLDTARSIWSTDIEHAEQLGYKFDNVAFSDKELAPKPFNIIDPLTVKYTCDCIKAIKPVATFIDTIRKTHDGDEDKSTVMKVVLERLWEAVDGSSLVIISHNRKGDPKFGEDDIMSGNRGSNYIAGDVDCVMRVTKKEIHYEGRTIDEHKMTGLKRTEKGFWDVDEDTGRLKAAALLAHKDSKNKSQRQLGRELSEQLGCHPEAARSLLKRLAPQRG